MPTAGMSHWKTEALIWSYFSANNLPKSTVVKCTMVKLQKYGYNVIPEYIGGSFKHLTYILIIYIQYIYINVINVM